MRLEEHLLMDGGTVYNTNIDQAVHRCRELIGDDDSRIIIDVLVCTERPVYGLKESNEKVKGSHNAFLNWIRARKISKAVRSDNSVAAARRAHPLIQFRHMV